MQTIIVYKMIRTEAAFYLETTIEKQQPRRRHSTCNKTIPQGLPIFYIENHIPSPPFENRIFSPKQIKFEVFFYFILLLISTKYGYYFFLLNLRVPVPKIMHTALRYRYHLSSSFFLYILILL